VPTAAIRPPLAEFLHIAESTRAVRSTRKHIPAHHRSTRKRWNRRSCAPGDTQARSQWAWFEDPAGVNEAISDDTQKLEIMVGLYELAISELFETFPSGDEARCLFVEDVRQVLGSTNELQPLHQPLRPTKRS
jgi:hypothetical protein